MYRVCGLQLGPNFAVRPAVDRNFQFRLTVEKMHALRGFTGKYLRPYGCRGINFTVMVNCTNLKIEIHIIGIEIYIVI